MSAGRVLLLVALALAGCDAAFVDPVIAGQVWYVSPTGEDGSDGNHPGRAFRTLQRALDVAAAGHTIVLAPGDYLQDAVSRRNGRPDAPITVTGPAAAILRGAGQPRLVEINHDHVVLRGFTIDGLHGPPDQRASYSDKLIYAIGTAPGDGVTGLVVEGMTLRNAGGECVRLRYFARGNVIRNSTIADCGIYDFRFAAGGKNGEGVQIGTSPGDLADGKNPTADPDRSSDNTVENNLIDTQGSECVDIKESAARNLIQGNTCRGNKDTDAAGVSLRSHENRLEGNTIEDSAGAGVRLGGDDGEGARNRVVGNRFARNAGGSLRVLVRPQGAICENTFAKDGTAAVVGSEADGVEPEGPCP